MRPITIAALSILLLAAAPDIYAKLPCLSSPVKLAKPGMSAPRPEKKKLKEWTVLVYANGNNNFSDIINDNINYLERRGSDGELDIVAQVSHQEIEQKAGSSLRNANAMSQGGILLPQKQSFYAQNGDKLSKGGILLEGSRSTVTGDPAMPPGQNSAGTHRYHIMKDSSDALLSSIEIGQPFQADAGDEKTLRDFLVWGKLYSPAKHYMVIILNHGAGYRGISFDDVSGSHITPDALNRALGAIGGADVLVMGACLMQMTEVAQRLQRNARYIVASEEIGWGAFYGDLTNAIRANASPLEMARRVAKNAHKRSVEYYDTWKMNSQTSVLDGKAMNGMMEKLEAWLDVFRESGSASTARYLRDHVMRFDMEYGKPNSASDFCDLYDLAALAAKRTRSPRLKAASLDLMDYIKTKVVRFSASIGHSDKPGESLQQYHYGYGREPGGISIYFPRGEVAKGYESSGLSGTLKWRQFIDWAGPKAEFTTIEKDRQERSEDEYRKAFENALY